MPFKAFTRKQYVELLLLMQPHSCTPKHTITAPKEQSLILVKTVVGSNCGQKDFLLLPVCCLLVIIVWLISEPYKHVYNDITVNSSYNYMNTPLISP